MFCKNCGAAMDPNAVVCVKCGCAKGTGASFCPNCGAATSPGAAVCLNCGAALTQAADQPQVGDKSKLVAGLLAIFLGTLGIHNFYLGYTGKAVAQLLVSLIGGIVTCGIATVAIEIWALIEGIMLLCGKITVDGKGNLLKD